MKDLYTTIMGSLNSEEHVTVEALYGNHTWAVTITAWYFDREAELPLLGSFNAANEDFLQAMVQALQNVASRPRWEPGLYIDMSKCTKDEIETAGIDWVTYWKHACVKHRVAFKQGNCPGCEKGQAWKSRYGDVAGCVLCASLEIHSILVKRVYFDDGGVGFDHKAYCKTHYDFIEKAQKYDQLTTVWYAFEDWATTFTQQAFEGLE